MDGQTRLGQLRLYDYLDRHYQPVKKDAPEKHEGLKHLGMRSGNLEMMALLGHQVRYMEEKDSIGGDRMAKWHEDTAHKGLTKMKGEATGYERLIVSPPTRSGKYLAPKIKDKSSEMRPSWSPKLRAQDSNKPKEILSEKKGFSEEDMNKIRDYLGLTKPKADENPKRVGNHQLDLKAIQDQEELARILKHVMLGQTYPGLKKIILPENAGLDFKGEKKTLHIEPQFIKHIINMGIKVSYHKE